MERPTANTASVGSNFATRMYPANNAVRCESFPGCRCIPQNDRLQGRMAVSRDFFISFNKADRDWAAWIAWTLEQHGYSVYFQDWDFVPGSNFVLAMDRATTESKCLVLVLSEDYLRSAFTASEWSVFFARDPAGAQQKLKPIRVRDCHPQGVLAPLVYTDLIGLPENEARAALLKAVVAGRRKPQGPVTFPGAPAAIYPGPKPSAMASPVLWIYVRTSFSVSEARYAELVSEIRSAEQLRVIEVDGSGGPEEADLAVLVLEDVSPAHPLLVAVRSELRRLDQSRVPTRVYLSKHFCDNLAGNQEVRAFLKQIENRRVIVFASQDQLLTAVRTELARTNSRLQQSIEEDGYLVSEHRSILASIRNGSYGKAERVCRSLLEKRPFSPRAHYNLACILTHRATLAKSSTRKRALLDRAQAALAEAIRFGIIKFTQDFVIGDSRPEEDAEKQILQDPDLGTLFKDRPHLRKSIGDVKRIQSFTGGGGGCIEAAMPVELSDGTSMPLYALKDSCTVRCWNERLQERSIGIVHAIKHYVVPRLVLIDGGLRLSPMHPVLTSNCWTRAADIRPGDLIVQNDGTARRVRFVSSAVGAFDVIDLSVDPHSNLSVRGCIVHNTKCLK